MYAPEEPHLNDRKKESIQTGTANDPNTCKKLLSLRGASLLFSAVRSCTYMCCLKSAPNRSRLTQFLRNKSMPWCSCNAMALDGNMQVSVAGRAMFCSEAIICLGWSPYLSNHGSHHWHLACAGQRPVGRRKIQGASAA